MLLESPPATSPAELTARLLHFINEVLPGLDRHGREWPRIAADTPLFATGLIDSLSILHLIAAIESFTGRPVPDELVVMKHFQSVEHIAAIFAPPSDSTQ